MEAAEGGAASGAAVTPAAAAATRLRAALPAGVRHELLDGPWMLPAADVVFDVNAAGTRRVLALNSSTNSVTYAGTLHDERVTIEQAFPATPDDINAWLERVQLLYQHRDGVKAENAQLVYGALVDVDCSGALAFYTVAQRPADSLASAVLAPDGALARIGAVARLRLVWQSAAALAALHARGRVHGNITPANALLSSADEGTAVVRVVGYATGAGTKAARSAAGDVHSWGALAWSVLAGAPTPATDGPPPMATLIERGVPAAVGDAVCGCFAADPKARPTMAAVTRTLAAALAGSQTAAARGIVAGTTAASRIAPGEPLSASAVVARDAMLQLALKTSTQADANSMIGAGSAAAATLRAFVTDVAVGPAARGARCHPCKGGTGTGSATAGLQLRKGGVGAALPAARRAHTSGGEARRAACHSLQCLAERESVCGPLVQCDGVGGALAAVLRSDAANIEVVRLVYVALRVLGASADHALALQRDGCGAAAIAALQRYIDNVEVAAAASYALWKLAVPAANHCGLVRDGADTAVLAALQRHVGDASVSRSGCGVLWDLTATEVSRESLLVRNGGSACATVAAVLTRHADNASVACPALHTLWNISVKVATRVSLVCDHSAADAVATALQRHAGNVDVVRAACGVLRNLTCGLPEVVVVINTGKAFVDALAAALQAHGSDAKVAIAGCWALCNIAEQKAALPLFTGTPQRSAEVVVGVLQTHMGDAAVVKVACNALRALAQLRTVRGVLPRVLGAGAAVLAALRRHVESDADTLCAITGALWNLAQFGSARALVGPLTSEHTAALRHIMAAHSTNRSLQLRCDDALTLLH